jgi:large subunit ribosomal protein L35
MPKMKTVRSACKRFTRTGTGKIKRNKAFATHLLKNKSTKRKRNFRRSVTLTSADEKRIGTMI